MLLISRRDAIAIDSAARDDFDLIFAHRRSGGCPARPRRARMLISRERPGLNRPRRGTAFTGDPSWKT
jgi:hypothetical protein